jgi:glycosyltransferase involved in cell wall biosynthesis
MTVIVVMPAWNEESGIAEFVREIATSLAPSSSAFVVIDDASTDGTTSAVRALSAEGIDVVVLTNPTNVGHGPSTVRALTEGFARAPAAVVAVDGDGQFSGADVARVVRALLNSDADVVEGVRVSRGDPWFRVGTSAATRALVWARCRRLPRDANTPLRAYRPQVLRRFLAAVPPDAMTPNLVISVLSRRWGVDVAELPVYSQPRRGASSVGTTWGAARTALPSRRFVSFCVKATAEWVRM